MQKINYFIFQIQPMNEKYEIKTYPEYFKFDDSDTDTEKIKTKIKSNKKATFINPKKFYNEVFQPECIFTKEKNNISFYESDSNNSCYKDRKYKSLNKKNNKINYDSDAINRKSSCSPVNYVEEKFSYNYTTTEAKEENKNDISTPLNQRICLDNFFHQNSNQVPKRTIKAYQNQFDVEKSDNFNVLSYRPEDPDIIKTDAKTKIIPIFKKQETGEIFYPSKRALSPLSPTSSNNITEKKEKLLSYQNPSLKFQSFFGSYMRPKHIKENAQTKSTSKIKKNQLEDFNIDKLIEIGDNFSSKWENILSFGKKIKNIKNKSKKKIKLNYNSENERLRKKNYIKHNFDEKFLKPENLTEIFQIPPRKEEIEENIKNNYDRKDKQILTKKIIYHGQIKRKKNIKNTRAIINQNQNKDFNNQNKVLEDINKNYPLNNKKKESNKYINNNSKNIYNIINSIKFKKINVKQNSKNGEIFFNRNKVNSLYQQISPKKSIQKKKIDISTKDNQNYSINNNDINNKIIKQNKFVTMINIDNKIQNDFSNKILLTEEDNILPKNNKGIIQQIKPNIKKAKFNTNIIEDQFNSKYNKTNFGNIANIANINKQNIKIHNNEFKIKNYFGYDERHNLEGPINNHSYYVSIYSRKKVNQKSQSKEKFNNNII